MAGAKVSWVNYLIFSFMGHHQKFFRESYPGQGGSGNDPRRLFIRRNRKKIFLFLGVGIMLLFLIIILAGILFFTVLIPAGTQVISQSVSSGEGQNAYAALRDLISQLISWTNPIQWLNLPQLK